VPVGVDGHRVVFSQVARASAASSAGRADREVMNLRSHLILGNGWTCAKRVCYLGEENVPPLALVGRGVIGRTHGRTVPGDIDNAGAACHRPRHHSTVVSSTTVDLEGRSPCRASIG